ncbi:MAG: hypothetical protein AVDCRST_MAG73-3374 [uncultured Thermomicrobiales bacterium]|uniref:Amidohydrolase-related domain-containing protein n=1 Tax=uncultured Thermomicrobiales bacterium TaxID=1645740 RepID=A0A6J4URN8_9BACT|nr:MAG: hypothetical protein AVDCRST_MAG73-3374 [uncultured Thermomicrobiales bacterium]
MDGSNLDVRSDDGAALGGPAPAELFDASCLLGRTAVHQPGAPTNADELVDALRFFGIGEALVFHADAAEYSPSVGNDRLIADIAGRPMLHPCWVLGPHQTGELSPPNELVPAMIRAGVRACRLCPYDHRFRFRLWNIGQLLERLAAHRTPVWVDFGMRGWTDEFVDWEGLVEVCAAFPHLPVILVRTGIGGNRRLFPAMERCPNLLIETSYYTVHRGIEMVAATFGAERVLFGSGFPTRAPGPAVTALAYARLSEADRTRIAGGNLRSLLHGVKP